MIKRKKLESNVSEFDKHRRDGMCLYIKQDYNNALVAVDKVLELNPDDYKMLKLRADIHNKLGNKMFAQADFQRMEELENENNTK